MSKLQKHFIVRFADNRPPLGESRLLGFATTGDQNNPQNPEQAVEDTRAAEQADVLFTNDTRRQALSIAPEGIDETMEQMEHSTDIFRSAAERDAGLQQKMSEILEQKFGLKFDPRKDADYDTFIERIPEGTRTQALQQLLGTPENSLHLRDAIGRRMDRYEELMRIVERNIKTIFGKETSLIDLPKLLSGTLKINEKEVLSLDKGTIAGLFKLSDASDTDKNLIFQCVQDAYKATQ